MATPDVPAITLRNGITIDDPLVTALEFVEQDSSYRKYDLAPVTLDDTLTREDIRIANQMIARMSPQVIDGIHARAGAIGAALAEISPDVTLAGPDGALPWEALTGLFRAIEGARGWARARNEGAAQEAARPDPDSRLRA